ncbi:MULTISPECIES: DNA (cytosine-5-)-methyltransferase [unclassified Psychrobacter]|uniref:DNA (cytosine-5-)-methyltransferase n=1 Tax=unclassified Psychrobacter TaxID=196806 RepID=UPI0018F4C6DA|nr:MULTISPECIES: DNA (cytosine-5-)-methyltransferase [unclassified Psychrobacter]
MKKLKFIDLFAGLGGTRIGFEQACEELGFASECVFTSEIKPYAVEIYKHNFNDDEVFGDITKIDEKDIPAFDYLLGGFPCQPFSNAGKRHGFEDTRGTLFFDIARIIKHHKPTGFLLENVDGLVTNDKGNMLKTIVGALEELGYNVNWEVLNSKNFGVPQERKRVYIVGHRYNKPDMNKFETVTKTFSSIKEENLEPLVSPFTERLLTLYESPSKLMGKAIKDKRGGADNIHSWDLELKGKLSSEQKNLLNILLKQRRSKKWAEVIGIKWMDGMPLTLDQIYSFYSHIDKNDLKELLDDLVSKKYLRFEHPKEQVVRNGKQVREYAIDKPKGYNIVTGKLSFELNKILDDNSISPTIVATEADRLGVIDNNQIRRLSERECLRFFGFPEDYQSNIAHKDLYDLIGNTVVVPVIKEVAKRII